MASDIIVADKLLVQARRREAAGQPRAVYQDMCKLMPVQSWWEQARWIYALRASMGDACQNYVEIGVFGGFSMACAMQAPTPCHHVGIDSFPTKETLPNSRRGWVRQATVQAALNTVNKHNHNFTIVRNDANHPNCLNWVEQNVPDIDLLYVDAEKTEEAVAAYWDHYLPLMRPGGIVVFNDYAIYHGDGVRNFFDNMRSQRASRLGVLDRAIVYQTAKE